MQSTSDAGKPVVLITGAGRGLGHEFARQYLRDGWRVIGTVRDSVGRDRLLALGGDVTAHHVDVTDLSTIRAMAAALKGVPIDVLVCNAGIIGPRGVQIGGVDYAAWVEVLRVNLLGPVAVAEALAENVAAGRHKVIAMISSRLGSISESGSIGYLLYGSSKSALNSATKALSVGLADRGVTVVALSPGWVRTDMGGQDAPLAPDTSVGGMRRVIGSLEPGATGKFFACDGGIVPW